MNWIDAVSIIGAITVSFTMALYMGVNVWADWYLNRHKHKYGILVLVACAIEALEDWRKSLPEMISGSP